MTDTTQIDIHELLAKEHKVAIIWGIEDVKEACPYLTDEQAWEVLQYAFDHHDATMGLTWESFEIVGNMLFGNL